MHRGPPKSGSKIIICPIVGVNRVQGGRALEMLAARTYAVVWGSIKVPQYWTLWQA